MEEQKEVDYSRRWKGLGALEPARKGSLKESEVAQETTEKGEGLKERRSRTLCHLVSFSWQSLGGNSFCLSLPHYLWPLQSPQRRKSYRIPPGRLLSWKAWAFQSQCYCRNIYHINSGKEEAWEAGPGRRQETWELLWFNLFFCFIFKNPLCKDVWSPSFWKGKQQRNSFWCEWKELHKPQ